MAGKQVLRPGGHAYNRQSVERALIHRLGPIGTGWRLDNSGWIVQTPVGEVKLRTLREAALFVVGARVGARLISDGEVEG